LDVLISATPFVLCVQFSQGATGCERPVPQRQADYGRTGISRLQP
jgi:hypothetical protein